MVELRPIIVFHGRHFVRHLGICNPICVKLLQAMSGVIPRNWKKKWRRYLKPFSWRPQTRHTHRHTDTQTHTQTHMSIAIGEMQYDKTNDTLICCNVIRVLGSFINICEIKSLSASVVLHLKCMSAIGDWLSIIENYFPFAHHLNSLRTRYQFITNVWIKHGTHLSWKMTGSVKIFLCRPRMNSSWKGTLSEIKLIWNFWC